MEGGVFSQGTAGQRCAGRYTERIWKKVGVPFRLESWVGGQSRSQVGLSTKQGGLEDRPRGVDVCARGSGNPLKTSAKGSLWGRVGGIPGWAVRDSGSVSVKLHLVMEGVGKQERLEGGSQSLDPTASPFVQTPSPEPLLRRGPGGL